MRRLLVELDLHRLRAPWRGNAAITGLTAANGGTTMYHELRKEILRIILSTSDGEMHQLCYDALMRMREAESSPQLATAQGVG